MIVCVYVHTLTPYIENVILGNISFNQRIHK